MADNNNKTTQKKKRPIALVECIQEIPCNPCATICPNKAIRKEKLYTRPLYDSTLCSGCGLCLYACPGLAIYLQIEDYDEDHATITFPWEYEPRPKPGDTVEATDRAGNGRGPALVLSVTDPKKNNQTSLVTLKIPKALKDEIRFMKRLPSPDCLETQDEHNEKANSSNGKLPDELPDKMPDELLKKETALPEDCLICRCEEVTESRIREAIRDGRHTVTAVKRATRAGMGACQGRTCSRLIKGILREEGIEKPSEDKTRYPIVPVAIDELEEIR
jgi:Fe-S-cluster-containing hydrogenase component 2/bacterioferritin-associated ferredoxin